MKSRKLKIPYIEIPQAALNGHMNNSFEDACSFLIDNRPWEQYPDVVKAGCKVAHNGDALFLSYYVEENHVVASSVTNGNIHKDSCVEFFISFGDDDSYYNLEFNCIGWGKIGYGKDRHDRNLLPSRLVESVTSFSSITSKVVNEEKHFIWEISFVIPITVFCHNHIRSFSSLRARGNFYKCSSAGPRPHYLTWNKVNTEKPDFHRKECFGELEFL
ncbi:carbohydrate-binding family 9-like protein [Sinomicrobium sp. M5D2P17]